MSASQSLNNWLPKLAGVTVLCVGDVMLDQYVYGDVERVSPEAPIPVLNVRRRERSLGGAGNVARNIAALGARARLVGVVGDDETAGQVQALLADEAHIAAQLVTVAGRPTTAKTRFIASSQQLLRADDETAQPVGEAGLHETAAAATAALDASQGGDKVGAVILSDYGKGVLADSVIGAVVAAARKAGVPVIVDPKGHDYTRYAGVFALTPNRRELAEATRMATATPDAIAAAAQSLVESCRVAHVLVTRGGEGMSLISGDGARADFPALAREVFDVSGAGDTVVAVLAAGLAAGMPTADAAQLANIAAGIVVGKVGTAVVRHAELADAIDTASDVAAKMVDDSALDDRVANWRARGLTIGFTNGCFDLVHPGHISLLEQARAECDRLIVGLNSDASVARLKGDGRPVQDAAARGRVLASLAAVDAVVVFDADTPLELIRRVRPDVLVKGADYSLAQVVGGDIVQACGGRVVLARLVEGFSTTGTIARLTR